MAYAQAVDETWNDYLDEAGSWGADRDEFDDAADFIGWYGNISHSKLGIAKGDAKNLYLAYHEGHGGYQRKSYLNKAWLKRVADRGQTISKAIGRLQNELKKSTLFFDKLFDFTLTKRRNSEKNSNSIYFNSHHYSYRNYYVFNSQCHHA